MAAKTTKKIHFKLKKPKGLSPRIQWLRDYYFKGNNRNWNNEFTSWTTGTNWDQQYNELSFYIVPENYPFLQVMQSSFRHSAHKVNLINDFWSLSLPERRAWFNKEVMVNYLPHEILPGDLIAGSRFNVQTSMCLNEKEANERDNLISGKNGVRSKIKRFNYHGYGNTGATCGHLIPGHEKILKSGWKGIYNELRSLYDNLNKKDQNGKKGDQLGAMLTASTMPRDIGKKYSQACLSAMNNEEYPIRKKELKQMSDNLEKCLWEPPETFWEACQALWINHMLIMSDENYPGPGVSFGRIDQYLFPYWEHSINNGMDYEFGKEILKCFWIHANTAYDALIRIGGNQGITSGFGQLITLSGCGNNGQDMTNSLTYAMLEVIDEMSPILEPKPNIRIHKNSPDKLLDKMIDIISTSQGAPFLINFDERSMAGIINESKMTKINHLINESNVYEYAPVGCLENTMAGNDRSGTVDNNLNLLKAVELTLASGNELIEYCDPVMGTKDKISRQGPYTGNPCFLKTWDCFWKAFEKQVEFIVKKCVDTYELSESIRSKFNPTPYLSCLVKGCAENALDITQGGPEINFTTINIVAFASTVDSLLAIKYLVYDNNICSMKELINALKADWQGYEILQAKAKFKAPKYGRDDDSADEMARKVMELWCNETWKYKTISTNRQFRPGLLSWNYWVSDGFILPASPDGRPKGQFLSNAICPCNGADINGPTANANSIGKALGGKHSFEYGNWKDYINYVPGGASHTITFNPSLLKTQENKDKFKAFLKGYSINGGTALQINMLDKEMLKEAQKHPQDYRHLLVRVTGYNAYFTSIGKELQDEIIARLNHKEF